MIDTHAHLQLPAFRDDLAEVIERAAEAGLRAIVIPGTDLTDSREAVALTALSPSSRCALYAAVGIHPTNANQVTPETIAELRELAQHARVAAIGEIGLDYYWPTVSDRGWPCAEPPRQREAFEAQLALAGDLGLPVILHDRDAHDDMFAILAAWNGGPAPLRGTLHAYAGGLERLERALSLGFAIGIDGPVTYRKATTLKALARIVPLDRLLLETDAPYLTPVPHRGRRNEPAYLPHIAAEIAAQRGLTPEAVSEATDFTGATLFRIDTAPRGAS